MKTFRQSTALMTFIMLPLMATSVWGQDKIEIEDESLPIYSFVRISNAVPTNGSDDVIALGLGIGVSQIDKQANRAGSNVGLRLIWIPDAPANPLQENGPDLGSAWGPVVDWQLMFSPRRRISVYTNLAVGFIYGKPAKNDEQKNRYYTSHGEEEGKNQVVPILEGGIGMRVLSRKLNGSGTRVYVAPELGYVPGIDAPYGALNFGIL